MNVFVIYIASQSSKVNPFIKNMRTVFVLALGLAVAVAGTSANRIIGGSATTIDQYPYAAVLLLSQTGYGSFWQACGSSVLTNKVVLTVAHCFDPYNSTIQWRVRVGSTYANSGGVVETTDRITIHPNYKKPNVDNDVALLRINGVFSFNNNVSPGRISGPNYNLADGQAVWAIGWGVTTITGRPSEQLRHVQIWTVNHHICTTRHAMIGHVVTDNMLCSGWLDVGGRDQCYGDSGSPLLHNGVIVGIYSWGERCALPYYPSINTRISRFVTWIQNNA